MTSAHNQSLLLGVPQRPLRRNVPDAILGGVCAGVACRLGVRVQAVRIVAALVSLFLGVGLLAYVVLWLALRRDGEDQPIARRLEHRRRSTMIILRSLVIALVALLILSRTRFYLLSPFEWSGVLGAVGLVAVWSGSSTAERSHLEGVLQAAPVLGAASARGWRAVAWRIVPATILITVGLQMLGRVGGAWGAAVPAFVGGVVLLMGILTMLTPWWLQNVRDLSHERRERIRAEERASLVTHVHDSVLQTLTLIERSAGNQADVLRLARAQERELRAWLFAPHLVGVTSRDAGTFAEQLHVLQHEVERDYGVRIELVIVGDCTADQRINDVIAATREAALNAAKWSGVDHFSIFGEVEADDVSVYVRDTGVGFDLDQVPLDRRGLARSIRERIDQIGGASEVTTGPGIGTEVSLRLPRKVPTP